MSETRHVMSVTVRDRPGVLVRIAALFARRGYNIRILSIHPGYTDTRLAQDAFAALGDADDEFAQAAVAAQLEAKAMATSETAGPRIDTPVSLQAARPRSGVPSHIFPTHRPVMKAMSPSTTRHLR